MKKNNIPCITPFCGGISFCRGLCHKCYDAAYWIIINGKTTWSNLIENGKAHSAKQGSNMRIRRKEWFGG